MPPSKSDPDGVAVALTFLKKELETSREAAEADLAVAQETASKTTQAIKRSEALKQILRIEHTESGTHPDTESPTHSLKVVQAAPDWEDIVRMSRQSLRDRGVDPDKVQLNDLLDEEEAKRIERMFRGGFSIQANLDKYDVCAMVSAGLVGALVDLLIVRIPADIQWMGELQEGSPVTKFMHSLSVPSDNKLAEYAKASYDGVLHEQVSGMTPRTHRLYTPGHDPLLGLVLGTIDIMRGGMTAISSEGVPVIVDGLADPVYNPFKAFAIQLAHLMSDAPTKMGLPPPGWSLIRLITPGAESATGFADIANYMYQNGYDSRHFLTMSSSVAALELVLRGYFWIRRKVDVPYNTEVTHQGIAAGSRKTSAHPRYQAMALGANAIATAANLGKVVVYSGNPLAINYAQWLRFVHALIAWFDMKLQSASHVLQGQSRANLQFLYEGWPCPDVQDPDFPRLVSGE
jgi:hypothetical protein